MDDKTILQYYGHDHDRLDQLLEEYHRLKDTDLPAARERFAEFREGLERHIAWEEDILFPEFERKTGQRDTGPTAVMRFEHRQIQLKLAAIAGLLDQNDPGTDAEEEMLHELLGMHNYKEENILYPAIDGQITPGERARIFADMGTH